MDWDKLRVFHAVAEAGSFTHAGESLNLSQSAVSRQISSLEDSLNVALFHRHARGLILTEQGEILFQTAREVFAKLSMAETRIGESRQKPSGMLRVTTTIAFGSVWLCARIKDFLEEYPDVDLHLLLTDSELDLGMREADVAIRLAPPRQPDLVARHLFTVHTHIYAAPSYLERYGSPETIEDLDQHHLVVYGADTKPPVPGINWLAEVGRQGSQGPRQPILTVNNVYAILNAVRSGMALGSLPQYMIDPHYNLIRVLPEVQGPPIEGYFAYPEEMRHSKRIEVFRDFLLRKIVESHF